MRIKYGYQPELPKTVRLCKVNVSSSSPALSALGALLSKARQRGAKKTLASSVGLHSHFHKYMRLGVQLPSGEAAPLHHASLDELGIALRPLHDVGAVSLEVSGQEGERDPRARPLQRDLQCGPCSLLPARDQ